MNILVSGAGISGLASALELSTRGHDVTIVEYARDLRLEGTPIDIRGDALEAADRMGLLAKFREQRVRMTELSRFVDSDDEAVAPVPLAEVNDSDDDVEILREDLLRILTDALPDTAAIRFGDSIEWLTDVGGGVHVRFSSGGTGRYDLVIGADGQHSTVRGLAFGPEQDYLRHLGVYFGLASLPDAAPFDGPNSIYNVPGRMAAIMRFGDKPSAAFQFRSGPLDYDRRDPDSQKRLLIDAFAGYDSWKIPQLLDAVRADPAFFFDSASQIRMPSWHRGRIVLVGDAGYCAAFLSGRGTSLALTGARFLAEELQRCGGDHTAAFERYEARQRPYVTAAQERGDGPSERMLPGTWAAIAARNKRLQAMSTGAS